MTGLLADGKIHLINMVTYGADPRSGAIRKASADGSPTSARLSGGPPVRINWRDCSPFR